MDSRSSGAQPSREGLGLGGPCHNASPELSENQLSSQDQGRCCALILGIFQQGSRSHFESSSPRNVSQNRQKDKGQQGFMSKVFTDWRSRFTSELKVWAEQKRTSERRNRHACGNFNDAWIWDTTIQAQKPLLLKQNYQVLNGILVHMMSSFFGGRIADIDGAQSSTQIGPQMYGRKSEKNYYKLVKSQKPHVICWESFFFFLPLLSLWLSV